MLHDPRPPTADARSGGVLVVEDNAVNALILQAMLRKLGFDPVMAANGREGVEMTGRFQPRLVFMDLQMPLLDGFAAASAIRSQRADRETVLVAVTAVSTCDIRDACDAAGFACVLAKPIVFADLMAVVGRFLES